MLSLGSFLWHWLSLDPMSWLDEVFSLVICFVYLLSLLLCLDFVALACWSEWLVFLILFVVLFDVFEFLMPFSLPSGFQVMTFSPVLPVVCLSTESV